MARDNGGIIGPVNDPTEDIASGVWSNESQYEARRAGNWPNNAFIGQNSLRFDDGSSDYLSRTPSSDGNKKTWTWSGWIKKGSPTAQGVFFDAGTNGGNNYTPFYLSTDQTLRAYEVQGGVLQSFNFISSAVFRDVSAWYHFVMSVDTTQATSSDRVKFYVNGEQITSFSTETYPAQNYDTLKNNTSYVNEIGRYSDASGGYFDGYMSDVYFIDGKQLEPTYFGAFDANGVWTPAASFTGDYGTNGFHLTFEDSSSLGKDSGPGGNDFTVNNLTSIDQTTDTPTNNFATLNPLATSSYGSLQEGNLRTIGINNADLANTFGTISTSSSGKWYWEIKINNTTSGVYPFLGIGDVDNPNIGRLLNGGVGATGETNYSSPSFHYRVDGGVYIAGSLNATYSSFTTGDIISFAVDMDNGASYIAKNNTWQNSGDPTSGASKTGAITTWTASSISGFLPSVTFYFGAAGAGNSAEVDMNFGSPPYTISSGNSDANGYGNFEYAVPSGYYALNTQNLAEFG